MNRILLATVAVLATTVAQAETIYVAPGSAVHFSTKKPFKTAISGDEELLVLKPGATNQDLLIVANQPDNALTGSANVLLIDDQGKLVEDIRVNVTPFGEDSETVTIHGWSGKITTYYGCATSCFEACPPSLATRAWAMPTA